MINFVLTIIGITFVGLVVYSIGYNHGFHYALEIYTGKRKVKMSKNPFIGRKCGYKKELLGEK